MRCSALSLLALVAAAAGYQIPPPSGLYETPTAEFGASPTQLNEVSQAPIGSETGDRDDGGVSVSQVSNGAGCCNGAAVQPAGPGLSGVQPAGPGLSGVQPALPSGGHSSTVLTQTGQPGQSQSSHTVSTQSIQSSPVVSLSSEQSQSGYYESASTFTQPAAQTVIGQVPSVPQPVPAPGVLPQRPSNVFLDNPGRFENQQLTHSSQTGGKAPGNYQSNVFLNGQQSGGNGFVSSSSSEFHQQGSSGKFSQSTFQHSSGSGSRPTGQLVGFGSKPTSQQSSFTSSQSSQQTGRPTGQQSTFISRQPGYSPTGQQTTFTSHQSGQPTGQQTTFTSQQSGRPTGQQTTFTSQQSGRPTGQQTTFTSQQTGRPTGQQTTFTSHQTGRPTGQQTTFTSQQTGRPTGQQSNFISKQPVQQSGYSPTGQQTTVITQQQPGSLPTGQQSTLISQQTGRQPGSLPTGQQSTFISSQIPQQSGFRPAGSGSQTGSAQLAPGQLLNRHPGAGGSGPLGHQLRTCSTSLVCVPIAMCNPYTGFVRGGLLFEPEEPTLQPTVALDRCTQLKDGGTGDGVCCQMPHINDPWPRDQ